MQYTIVGGIKYKNKATKKMNIPAFEPTVADIYTSDATVLVKEGDKVATGSVIARNENGFTVYSSLDGEITAISDGFVSVCGKYNPDALPIEEYSHDFSSDNRSELISYMLLSGLPDSVEISLRQEMGNTRYVIINCMSEPSSENAEKILNGAKIILLALGIRSAVITLSKKNKKLARAFEKLTYDRKMFLIAMLPRIHPLEIPEAIAKALYPYTPFDDVFVLSPSSCISTYDVFNSSKPYVGHNLVIRYKKYYAPVFCPSGTRFEDLNCFFSENGPKKDSRWENIVGLSGIGINRHKAKIIGGDIRVVSFKKASISNAEKYSCCISCGKCREVCPAELSPYIIASGVARNGIDKCISCGCCSQVCPACIGLAEIIDGMKGGVNDEK